MGYDKVVDSAVLDGYFEDIADAIRDRSGASGTYSPSGMPQAITDIPHEDTFADIYIATSSLQTYENSRIQSVNNGAFAWSNVKNVSLPNSIGLGSYSFYYSMVETVDAPNATTVGSQAFKSAAYLSYINIPKVTNINDWAFQSVAEYKSTPLSLNLPNVTYIANNAFEYANVDYVTIPKAERLSDYILRNSKIKELTIPESCTSIGTGVCYNCQNLTKLVIERDITRMPYNIVYGCSSLEELDLTHCTQVPTLGSVSELMASDDFIIKVPAALEAEWKTATNWTAYASKIQGV